MKFSKASLQFVSEHNWDTEKFTNFRDEFGVVGYYWIGGFPDVSASYFVKLLQKGKSARPPYGSARTYEIYCWERTKFSRCDENSYLFNHTMLWSLKTGQVICTSMPYGERDLAQATFANMAKENAFPASIKLKFLDEKYRYRPNGNFMLMIYSEEWRKEDE